MNNLICPKCGNEIEITSVLKEQVEKDVAEKFKKEIEQVKKDTELKIKGEIEEKNSMEMNDLKNIVEENKNKINEMRQNELKIREEKRRLEEKEKENELNFQRQLDEERNKIEYESIKKSDENHRLKDLEKEKQLSDAQKTISELQRQLSQGSQQSQGEILELDVENTLKISFPNDQIEPVEKGIKGADIQQIVKSPKGISCGTILWETKRTKAWTDEWLVKLKNDLRSERADIPVIISVVLPQEAEGGLGIKEGVWIVGYKQFLPLAILIRKNLLDIGYQKAISVNQGRKADFLYEFITGNEFRQQVESLVEVFTEMQEQLNREKIAFEKIWKTREGQIKRLISGTVNIYGKAQGLVGSSMPQIKGLELLEITDQANSADISKTLPEEKE